MHRICRPSSSHSPLPCVGEEVQIRSRGGVPIHLEWHERVLPVLSVESSWCVSGRWWLDSDRRGVKRRYFRVNVQAPTGHPLCLELFRTKAPDTPSSEWRVWRIAD